MTEMHQIDAIRRNTTTMLRGIVPPGPVALLDYPHYFNAGDHLIYEGTTRYLADIGCRIDYVCAPHTYDPALLSALVPVGPILLQGGGNFGDRWPMHQRFRERVLADFPDRAIVQLPQSVDFSSPDALAAAVEAYDAHPNLTLLVRDRRAAERAADAFAATVRFCPDLAFGATPQLPSGTPTANIVMLARRDAESVHSSDSVVGVGSGVERVDWSLGATANVRWWGSAAAEAAVWAVPALRRRAYPAARRAMDRRSALVLDAAVTRLGRGRVVVTDRLHGGVLAALLGIPVVLVDNVNKKVSTLYDEYLGVVPNVHLAEDFGDAMRMATSLLAGTSR